MSSWKVWWCWLSILTKTQSWRKRNCIASACTDTCTQMHRIRLGGYGACSSRKIFKIWCSEMASEAILGLKTSLTNLGMITEFASRPHAWRLVAIGKPGKEAVHKSQSIFCYSGSYSEQLPSRMCGHRALNLVVLRSPQLSFTLGPQSSWGYKSVLAICMFLACKRRVGNIIPVKTLVQWLLGLPDLLRLPCQREMNAQQKQYH